MLSSLLFYTPSNKNLISVHLTSQTEQKPERGHRIKQAEQDGEEQSRFLAILKIFSFFLCIILKNNKKLKTIYLWSKTIEFDISFP